MRMDVTFSLPVTMMTCSKMRGAHEVSEINEIPCQSGVGVVPWGVIRYWGGIEAIHLLGVKRGSGVMYFY
eukprot:764706-Hanusia_phi.AAC.8